MLIKTKNLTKIYKSEKIEVTALNNINLEIKKGEFVSIMGPSGSGKSTLLNLLGCLDTPTSGQYFLEGIEINRHVNLAKIRREKVGFVFQTFNLIPRLSALKNVEVPMIYKGLPRNQRKSKALELLEAVGLEERAGHTPSELSGGEKQRVAIARSLANDPSIILADEPTGNLDSQSGKEILKILKKINAEGATVVLVSHNEDIAKKTDRIMRIRDGTIIDDG